MDRERYLKNTLLVLLVIALDLGTKIWAKNTLVNYTEIEYFGNFLAGYCIQNYGVALGTFADVVKSGGLYKVLILNVVCVVCAFWMFWAVMPFGRKYYQPCALFIGGALANLADRAINGSVTDFIVFHYENMYYSPIINIADIVISLSGVWLFCNILRSKEVFIAQTNESLAYLLSNHTDAIQPK